MTFLKSIFLFLTSALSISVLMGQSPVSWTYKAQLQEGAVQELVITATIQDGWSTYSQFLQSEQGPVATQFVFAPGVHYEIVGKTTESGEITTTYDDIFEMDLTKIKHKGVFTQKVVIKDASKPIKGTVEFMVCNHEMCLPPKTVQFEILPVSSGK
jgi:Disulphide bond corrector protein DsbC